LNPQMEYLFKEMAAVDRGNLADLDQRLAQFRARHPFHALLNCRAPDPDLRTVTLQTPSRASFQALASTLGTFHFNVLVLVQLRRLGEAYLAHRWDQVAAWRAGKLDVDTRQEMARRL